MRALRAVLERHGVRTGFLRRLKEAPDNVWLVTGMNRAATEDWKRLRALVSEMGRWPVLLGSHGDLRMRRDLLRGQGKYRPTKKVLEAADAIDPVEWFARERRRLGSEYPVGEWPEEKRPPAKARKWDERP